MQKAISIKSIGDSKLSKLVDIKENKEKKNTNEDPKTTNQPQTKKLAGRRSTGRRSEKC